MLVHEALQAGDEAFAHLRAVVEQVFIFDDLHAGKSGGGAGGAATEGGDVAEVGVVVGGVVHEVLEDLFGGHGAGDGSVTGSNALSHGDDVGLDVEVLVAEPLAGTAKAAHDFVHDQEQVVLVADLADGFVIACRGHEDAAASGHGFDDHAAEFIGTHGQDDFFELVGHLFAEVGAIAELGAIDVAVRELIEAGSEGTVLNLTFKLAASAQGADGGAMVVTVTIQDAGFLAAVFQLADLTDDLESLFVGFGTGVGEIHAAHAGHLGDQLFGKFDGGDVADAVGEVAHFEHLLGDGVNDFLAAVADVDGPHAAGHGVDVGLAVDVGDAHAFALHIDGGLKVLVLGQMVPHMLLVEFDIFGFIVGHRAFLIK